MGRDTTPCLLWDAERGDPRIRKSREVASFTGTPSAVTTADASIVLSTVFSSSLPPFGNVSLISPDLADVKQQLQESMPGQGRVAELKASRACCSPVCNPKWNSSNFQGWLGRRNFHSLELCIPKNHPRPPGMQDILTISRLQIKAAVPPTSCSQQSRQPSAALGWGAPPALPTSHPHRGSWGQRRQEWTWVHPGSSKISSSSREHCLHQRSPTPGELLSSKGPGMCSAHGEVAPLGPPGFLCDHWDSSGATMVHLVPLWLFWDH